MKNKILLFAVLLMVSCVPSMARATDKETSTSISETRIAQIQDRVDAIRAMKFSTLTSSDRKELRQELRGMKHELRSSDPVIYISAGALILIIILLILLL